MVLVPCLECRIVFESAFVRLFGTARIDNLSVIGCSETCPKCGRSVRTPDGVYDVDRIARTVIAKGVSNADVAIIRSILAEAQKGTITPERAQEQIKESIKDRPWWPEVERILPKNSGQAAGTLALLLVSIAAYLKEEVPPWLFILIGWLLTGKRLDAGKHTDESQGS